MVSRERRSTAKDRGVEELAQYWRQDTGNYMTDHLPNDAHRLELFRRAISDQDQAAWQAIYVEYQALVSFWIKQHSHFDSIREEARFLANEVFARFWYTGSLHKDKFQFDALAPLLSYLKACVHSVIQDEWRRQRRRPRDDLTWGEIPEILQDTPPSLEARAVDQVVLDALTRAIASRLQGEEEKVVAALSWTYGLRPSEIQARRPDLFPDVRRVYQVKRNILNRLQRDCEIRKLVRQIR
jgi:DNA-directed RNA polymerase specialized sigma24 family protein